jgi:DNA polymerase-3 subunit epsilon
MLKLKTDRPLCVFDIEATGVNPRNDRIVSLAIVKVLPGGQAENHSWLVNPERPIPPEATAIHRITDDEVRHSPPFRAVADRVEKVLEGCDLGGYNILHFDIPMLMEEFLRAGKTLEVDNRRVVDAQRIFHKREPRDLGAALQFYCGEFHLNAHGALDDALATVRVIEGQFRRYQDLPRDIEELDRYCNPRDPSWADRTGKFKWVDGELVVNFGRNQGRKLRELAKFEPNFLKWMLNKEFPRDVTDIVKAAMEGRFPAPPPPAPAANGIDPAATP